jgi:hypothetical protein
MAWLKLTDDLWGNRKTQRLLKRGQNGSGLTAFGLHMAALLHCSKYLTDGYVEPDFVEETLDDAKVKGKARAVMVDSLVEGGQWKVQGDGWQVHDYLDHNPSRAEVLKRRAKDAERKARGRATQSADSPHGQDEDTPRSPVEVPAPSDGPVPSRPVPSTEQQDESPRETANGFPGFEDVRERLGEMPELQFDEMGVLSALRRAEPAGVDMLDLADATIAAARGYLVAGTLRTNASGLMHGLLTRREDDARAQLAAKSAEVRAAFERPGRTTKPKGQQLADIALSEAAEAERQEALEREREDQAA